jgi:NADH:ubiquinone oxidoreductase subunit 6 (subunit J)
MFTIILLLFAGAVLALVVGAMMLLNQERSRQDRNDARYRFSQRRIR